MKILTVDTSWCQGHGKCYGVAPDLVEPMDDLGHAQVISGPIDEADADRIAQGEAAIAACPEQALSWQES